MKICHVTNQLPGYHKIWGGAEQGALRTIKLLAKNKVENMVLATKPLKEVKENFEFYSVPVMQNFFGEKIGNMFKRPFDIIAYYSAYKILKKTKPDIVHFYHFGNLSLGVILAAKKLGIPIVFSVYDYWCFCPLQTLAHSDEHFCKKFHGPWCTECLEGKKDFLQKLFISKRRKIFDELFFKNVDKFISLSEFVAKLLQRYGIKKDRIELIPLPVTINFSSLKGIDANSILFMGWVVPRKGLDVALDALPIIIKKFPKIKLNIIGKVDPFEEEYKEKILKMIKKNRLEKNVELFLGEPPKKSDILGKASILIVPEQWQNMSPLIVTEGMLMAKPIVASNLGGIPELIENNKTGLLAKANSPKDFANKIMWLLTNKNQAKKMGINARKKALKMFDERVIARKLISLYKSLI